MRPGGTGKRGSQGAGGRRSCSCYTSALPPAQIKPGRAGARARCAAAGTGPGRGDGGGRVVAEEDGGLAGGRRRWSPSALASCSEPWSPSAAATSCAPARPRDRRTTRSTARSPFLTGPRRIRVWGGEKLVVVSRICASPCSVAARHPRRRC
jgi:hypothetical protein